MRRKHAAGTRIHIDGKVKNYTSTGGLINQVYSEDRERIFLAFRKIAKNRIQKAVRCSTLPHVCVCVRGRGMRAFEGVRGRVFTRKKACMKSGGVRVCVEVSWRWSRGTAPAGVAVR